MVLTCSNCKKQFSKLWKNVKFERAERGCYCSRDCYLQQFKEELVGDKRVCSLCKKAKDSSLFLKRYSKGRRGKPSSSCKACFCEGQMVRWNAVKIEIVEKLGGKCAHCNGVFHPSIYDLHHTDPSTKKFDWSELRRKSASVMLEEVAKCVLICSNCHRLEHINLETWEKSKDLYDKKAAPVGFEPTVDFHPL